MHQLQQVTSTIIVKNNCVSILIDINPTWEDVLVIALVFLFHLLPKVRPIQKNCQATNVVTILLVPFVVFMYHSSHKNLMCSQLFKSFMHFIHFFFPFKLLSFDIVFL
jgi:hypothetical protein